MATIAAPAPLNSEPADPGGREENHLPPKTYKDAVDENLYHGSTNGMSGKLDTHGANGSLEADGVNGHNEGVILEADVEPLIPSVLNLVDTAENTAEERPNLDRQLSKQEYSATGLDNGARTPPLRHKHPLQKTNSLMGSPIDTTAPISKFHDSNKAEVKVNGETTLVFAEVEDGKNGSKLISVKAPADYESALQTSKKQDSHQRDKELATGRKPGQRWGTSSIRFAPMNVPLQRRLQTLVVLFHTLSIALSVSAFFFLCAIPIFWPLLIPYMIYCMASKASTNGKLSHRSKAMRSSSFWSLFGSYFPARLHRSQELLPTRKYIFGYHPHGIISHGAFAAFSTEALGFSQLFPGITNSLLTLDSNFRIPIYRDYALAMGLASVSKESCENILNTGGPNNEGMGRAITIVVGGATESLDAQPYSLRLVLQRRKGFIKLAIRTGADLVPVLAFGENDLYDQFQADSHPHIHKFQLLVKKLLGFTIPLFHARGVFNYDVGLLPYRRPLNIVVGKPIKVTQAAKPSQEELEMVHAEYVRELERLWDTWKDDFAKNRQGELEIME